MGKMGFIHSFGDGHLQTTTNQSERSPQSDIAGSFIFYPKTDAPSTSFTVTL